MSHNKWIETLRNSGVTNNNSEDYGTIATSKGIVWEDQARCTSHKCCHEVPYTKVVFNTYYGTYVDVLAYKKVPYVIKNVSKTVSYCPDCRSALQWKPTPKRSLK